MTSIALRRLAVGAVAPAVLFIGLSACGSGDASKADLESELKDQGLTEEQASCVADRVYDELDQDEINDLAEAEDFDDADPKAAEVLTTATTDCLSAE